MKSYALTIILFIFLLNSCRPPEQVVQTSSLTPDGKYDSEFPSQSISKELTSISRAVKKLDCLAFYVSYIFDRDNTLDKGPLTQQVIKEQSLGNSVTNESVTGTAIVVYNDGTNAGLLTCAHVIDFPDTIIVRYDDGDGPIQVLSVKVRQQNYIKDMADGEEVEVIAIDDDHDLALLKKKIGKDTPKPEVLNYPLGNTRDLEWGSVVYIMGFPQGQQMVTRAIVSLPDGTNRDRFLTDAIYNRGISGAPVFAIRDGVPNLEWVGVATSSAAKQIFFTRPEKESPEFINPDEPYTGDIFVDRVKTINYGVTFNTSIEAVEDLVRKNDKLIRENGLVPEYFFK